MGKIIGFPASPGGVLGVKGAPGRNLIRNGSFEQGGAFWNFPPFTNWSFIPGGWDGAVSAQIAGALGYYYLTQAIRIRNGRTYRCSFWLFSVAGNSASGAGVHIEGVASFIGSINNLQLGALATGGVWQQKTFEFIATADSDALLVLTNAYGGTSTGDMAFDAVELRDITGDAYDEFEYGVPLGGIILWSGLAAAIPLGWQLCDGTNGTPDLNDRFIVGSGATSAIGTVGGTISPVAALTNHAGHANHVVTQPTAHGAISAHNAHTAFTTSAPTGTSTAYTAGSPNLAASTGHTHTATATPVTHAAHAALTNNHAGTAVDAHSAHDGHTIYKFFVLAYIMKMSTF